MASLPHHHNKVIYDDITINRTDGLTTSIDVNIKIYKEQDMISKTLKYNDENGNEQTYEDWDYKKSPFISNRKFNYVIPFEERTMLEKGTKHPHNHTEEIKYQERFTSWVEGYRATEEYITGIRDLNNKVL